MRLILSLLVGLPLVSSAFAAPSAQHGVATILNEVKKHLAVGQKCYTDGSYDLAEAHANLVLISDNVSVGIKYENVNDNQQQLCRRALEASLKEWEVRLGDSIHFNIIDDSTKADLAVRYRPDVRMGIEQVAGMTNWTRTLHKANGDTQSSFKADVQVRERDTSFKPMSFEAMRQETEHEIGHCLGLDDSNAAGDLMGPLDLAHLVSSPREWEVAAVKSVRDQARQLRSGRGIQAQVRCCHGRPDLRRANVRVARLDGSGGCAVPVPEVQVSRRSPV